MKKTLYIILFSLITFNTYSQQIDTLKIIRKADSIVIANSSLDFLNYIKLNKNNFSFSKEIDLSNPKIDLNKISDSVYEFTNTFYGVYYSDLDIKNENIFIKKNNSSRRAMYIKIVFDSLYNVIEQSDFKSLEIAKNKMNNLKIISREEAEKISEPLFKIKTKEQSYLYLEYDVDNEIAYWNVSKTKKRYTKETILINAETGKVGNQEVTEVKYIYE